MWRVTVLLAQSFLTLCDPMDCHLPGSSVHGNSPSKNAGVGSHSLLGGIFPTQGSNPVSCTGGRFLTIIWTTRKARVHMYVLMFVVLQSLSHVWLFVTPWTAVCQAFLFLTISQSLLKLLSIKLVMSSNHLILCYPLLLRFSIFPSIKVFFRDPAFPIRWPKYWSFSFSISPSSEYLELISFRMDWFDFAESKRLSRVLSSTTVQKH